MVFLFRTLVNALGLWIAAWLLPGMTISGSDTVAQSIGTSGSAVVSYVVIGLIFGVVNALIRPVVAFVSMPITCLTLGLFGFVVSAVMLWLTAWISGFTPFVLEFDSFFWTAVLAAVITGIVSFLASAFEPSKRREASAE